MKAAHLNTYVWAPALTTAGVAPGRRSGMHALRHWYASVLLDAGDSVKAVSEYLGHASAAFTLATYTHLMPTSEQRSRKALDLALGGPVTADGAVTARAGEYGPGPTHPVVTDQVGG